MLSAPVLADCSEKKPRTDNRRGAGKGSARQLSTQWQILCLPGAGIRLDQKPAGVASTSPTVIFSIHGRGRSGQLWGKPGDRCWANRPGLQRLHALGPCCTDAIEATLSYTWTSG
jgi:hypothetical protein